MSDIAIKIENLSKQYRLGVVGTGTISHDLKRWWTVNVRQQEDPYLRIGETNDRASKGMSDYVWALKDIDLEIKQGDVVGIIGKNGAGKSTLLKILSKVTKPTTGSIQYKGRIASLLEVGTGFHQEMTGRENIYMNGAIMGMSRAEITRKLDEIIDFAGVERYIDTPVKRYSSGMTVRLGFSIAAHLEPDILVVDEVLAVGDAEFQKKAIGKMQDVSQGLGRTVLFVSHNLGSIKQLCTSGIHLKDGFIHKTGNINDVILSYTSESNNASEYFAENQTKDYYLKYAGFLQNKSSYVYSDKIEMIFEIVMNKQNKSDNRMLIRIMDEYEQVLFACEVPIDNNKNKYNLTLKDNSLVKGMYSVHCILYQPAVAQYDVVNNICNFNVLNNNANFAHLETFDIGNVYFDHLWM